MNNCDFIERLVYNEKKLEKMKMDKYKAIKKELNNIKNALREEKHRYFIKNKEAIREKNQKNYMNFIFKRRKK